MNQPFAEKSSENNTGIFDSFCSNNLEGEGLTGSDFKLLEVVSVLDENTFFEQIYENSKTKEEDELNQRLKEKGIEEEEKKFNKTEEENYSKKDTGITLKEISLIPIQSEDILKETKFTVTNIMAQLPLNVIRSNKIEINLEILNRKIMNSFFPNTEYKKPIPAKLYVYLKDPRRIRKNIAFSITNHFCTQITGVKSMDEAFYFIKKGCKITKKWIKKYDSNAIVKYNQNNFEIKNIKANANILKEGFELKFYDLIQEGYYAAESKNFHRFIKKYENPDMTVSVLKSGFVTLSGGNTIESMEDTFKNKIYPELSRHIYKK